MPYSYSQFSDLKTALAGQLSDPAKVHFTDTELGILLNAAFREWNSISRMFRDRGIFNTDSSTTYYDLRSVLTNGAGQQFLSPIITDAQLIQQAKYMLMEPSPDDLTTFTDGLTLTDFSNYLIQCRNQFLLETGLVISQPTPQVVSSGEGRIQIDDDSVIDVRRATWTDLDGNITQLFREDEFTSSAFAPLWPQTSGAPQRYSIYPDPLLTLQLIPPPVDNGTLTLQSISSGAVLDDFTPTILWGVLANILSSPGPCNEPLRAQYAKARWEEGLIVGRQIATVLQSYLNGVPVTTESAFNLDTFQPSWQVRGAPQSVGLLGSNLAVVAPAADGVYSVTIDAVRNAPQLEDDDPVPFGREYIDLFLDYAGHLALFKHGGTELQATLSAYDSFVKAALAYNNRMSSQNLNFDTMVDKANQQEEEVALRREVAA